MNEQSSSSSSSSSSSASSSSLDVAVIFLDCDGVLNADWHGGGKSRADQGVLDLEMVQSLGKFVHELVSTGLEVKIVVSSTWRQSARLSRRLRAALASQKLEHFSKTPSR